MTLENYAMKILADAGCDCYTYGGEQAKHILDDLKEEFKNGMEYPYIDVANAILAISRPRPIVRAPYRVWWDTDSCCDGYDCESFGAAKCSAEDTLCEWMCEEFCKWADPYHPTEEQKEDWDYMIWNCGVSVAKYNPHTDEYEECWSPSQEELDAMGWAECDEMLKMRDEI